MDRPKAPAITGKLMYGERRAKTDASKIRKAATAVGRSQQAAPRAVRSA